MVAKCKKDEFFGGVSATDRSAAVRSTNVVEGSVFNISHLRIDK